MRKVVIKPRLVSVRRQKYRELNWKKLVYSLLVIVLIFSVGLAGWGLVEVLKIREVKCYSEFKQPCFQIEVSFLDGYNKTFLPITWLSINNELKSKFSYLEKVELSFSWQRDLIVTLTRAKPVAMVSTEELAAKNRYFMVTKTGVVLDEKDAASSPIFIGENIATSPGGELERSEQWVVELLDSLTTDGVETTARSTTGGLWLQLSKSNKQLIILVTPMDKNPNQITDWVRILLNDNQIQSGTKIDLRYDKPVLVSN